MNPILSLLLQTALGSSASLTPGQANPALWGSPEEFPIGSDTLSRSPAGQRPNAKHYAQATADLQLNPQERDLYERHLRNLVGPGGVDNPDGSRSTLFQSNVEHNGRYYNIPTVYDGKILPWEQAADRASAVGWNNFPSYASEQEAEDRYNKMHHYMEQDTADYQSSKHSAPIDRIKAAFEALKDMHKGSNQTETAFTAPPSSGPSPFDNAQWPYGPSGAPTDPPKPLLMQAQAQAPVPMPAPRPSIPQDSPAAMGFFQRNAALQRDPLTGDYLDPAAASKADAGVFKGLFA